MIPFTWDDATSTLTIGQRQGSFPGMLRQREFTIVLPDKQMKLTNYAKRTTSKIIWQGKTKTVSYDGNEVKITMSNE